MRCFFETMQIYHSFWNFSVFIHSPIYGLKSLYFIQYVIICQYTCVCIKTYIYINSGVHISPLLANENPVKLAFLSLTCLCYSLGTFLYNRYPRYVLHFHGPGAVWNQPFLQEALILFSRESYLEKRSRC